MLTLKGPIELHSVRQGLTGNVDSFCQKIQGNYGLIGRNYTARDLLFLLTAPPELPEDMGGMTTLVSNQTTVDARSITLDVVNNVINRIMLDGSSQFTYQDQVYITNVLNRLGVNNIEQFMTQVRQLRAENESTVHLTRLYRAELERILEKQLTEKTEKILPVRMESESEATAYEPDPSVMMSLNILQRLNTTELYETVHAFQRNWIRSENHFHRNEMRLSEQLRFSNQVSLAELKQQIYHQPQLSLQHHLNQYEAGTILEIPQSEEQVLSQAAVAALVTAVDNTVVEVLNRPQYRQEQWIRLENALWQTAENTLSRFETYHTHYQPTLKASEPNVEVVWNRYAQELREYLSVYPKLHTEYREQWRMPGIPPAANLLMAHLTQLEEGDQISEETLNEIQLHSEQTRTVIRELLETREGKPVQIPPQIEREILLHRETLERNEEHFRELQRQETILRQDQAEQLPESSVIQIVQPDQIPPEITLPPLELTPHQAEEQAPEALVEHLERINQNNKTILQTIQQAAMVQKPLDVTRKGPDMRRTIQDSLRALEEPELVLREIYEEGLREKEQKTSYTPQEQAILKQASPQDRILYERILAFQKDPDKALAEGLVRPGNMGALTAELQLAMEQTPVVQEHLETVRETEKLREETETVLEHFLHLPPQQRRVEEFHKAPPQAVRIVHKQAAPDISEELIEELQQRTRQTIKTESSEEITRHSAHQTELTQTEHQVVRQTTEDVTELVNRTLARQMRTISDQVYKQMERRLQTERSRRGRF